MTREELIQLYQNEDKFWSIETLINWLVHDKGIPQNIALLSLEEAIQDVISGKVEMPTHRFDSVEGCIGFDNYVLQIAHNHMATTTKLIETYIEKRLDTLIKQKLGGNRLSKMWRALIGKI
ncbi:MAG: hypothetical protein QXQ53_01120 [Candidatus Methanosuratincola sp.]